MSKKTKGKLIFTLAAVLAAGSATAAAGRVAAQCSDSLIRSTGAEKQLYCETDTDYVVETHHT